MTSGPSGESLKDRRGKFLIYVRVFLVAIAIFALDALTKMLATSSLTRVQSVSVIPNIFHFTLVLNDGVAFGLLKDKADIFIPVSLGAIAFIILYIRRSVFINAATTLALGLILGGSAGNLIDRIRFGYVIDFLDFRIWPVFNIADSAISVGAGILILSLILNRSK
jgi:signal peptidase II